jgi:hypothetical protein
VTGRTIFSPKKFLLQISIYCRRPRGADKPNLNFVVIGLLVLFHVDVDGEMGVHVAHLVLVAFRDADDQVVDDGLNGAERGDVLAAAVVDLDLYDGFLGQGEADGDVGEVFC